MNEGRFGVGGPGAQFEYPGSRPEQSQGSPRFTPRPNRENFEPDEFSLPRAETPVVVQRFTEGSPEDLEDGQAELRSVRDDSVQFDIRRHPIKKGEMLSDIAEKKGVPELQREKVALPVEGIIEAQKKAVEFAKKVEQAPEGTVYFGVHSNISRTKEANFIFEEEVKYIARKHPEWLVVDVSYFESQKLKDVIKTITSVITLSTDRKIILLNGGEDEAMGMYSWNMDEVVKEIDATGGDENEVLKKWLDDPQVQQRLGVSPQEVVGNFRNFIAEKTRLVRDYFPGRPAMISGIAHSWELDAAFAAMLGKDLSGASMDEIGGMINTMEDAQINVAPDGRVSTQFRGIESSTSLNAL